MSTHPHKLGYAELDRLTAEVLPPRLLLSSGPMNAGHGDQTEVYYACQVTQSPGTTGLLGTGLLAQAPYSTTSCTPAVVAHDNA